MILIIQASYVSTELFILSFTKWRLANGKCATCFYFCEVEDETMRSLIKYLFICFGFISSTVSGAQTVDHYPWLTSYHPEQSLINRISPPSSYQRVPVVPDSFAYWLRHLPLKPGNPAVRLYNGELKPEKIHVAVVEMDVGAQDLQQCADAIIRLRAEYLRSQQLSGEIHFNFTSGDEARYAQWQQGHRPQVRGNQVRWRKIQQPSDSYSDFRDYLNAVFTYAGSYSLSQELRSVKNVQTLQAGDIFIQGGFPGHAVIVVDVAAHVKTGEKIFLLAQSFMPAQEMHILKNLRNGALNPWYSTAVDKALKTPQWTFKLSDLQRFD